MSAARTDEIRQAAMHDAAISSAEMGMSFHHPVLERAAAFSRDAATAVAAMLSPASAIALMLGCWRLGTDLGWTRQFPISNGLFSHWEVWFALAIVFQALATTILRAGNKSQFRAHS